MAITTYSGLSTTIYRRLNRTAESAVFDDCVALAEAEINRRLALKPVRPMHTTVSLSVAAELVNAPADIVDVDSLKITTATTTDRVLATTPQNIAAMFEADDATGQPRYYAQIGSQFRFYPAPDQPYTGSLIYWAKVPGLTSTATTNWLSLAHPDVYLHGVMAYAMHDYTYPEGDVQAALALFDAALERVLGAYPRQPDRAPLQSDDLLRTPRRFDITTG
jgi:hypothetical protein